MVRVPIGNSKSMRVEVRSVAPDANPYLVLYSLFRTGIDGSTSKVDNLRQAERYLPDNIYDAPGLLLRRGSPLFFLGRFADSEAGRGRLVRAPTGHVCERAGGSTTTSTTKPVAGICSSELHGLV